MTSVLKNILDTRISRMHVYCVHSMCINLYEVYILYMTAGLVNDSFMD